MAWGGLCSRTELLMGYLEDRFEAAAGGERGHAKAGKEGLHVGECLLVGKIFVIWEHFIFKVNFNFIDKF